MHSYEIFYILLYSTNYIEWNMEYIIQYLFTSSDLLCISAAYIIL